MVNQFVIGDVVELSMVIPSGREREAKKLILEYGARAI